MGLLPTTARAWGALVALVAVCGVLSFVVSSAAGVTVLAAAMGLALLALARIIQRGQLRRQADALATLADDVHDMQSKFGELAEQISLLRVTVAQTASDMAKQAAADRG